MLHWHHQGHATTQLWNSDQHWSAVTLNFPVITSSPQFLSQRAPPLPPPASPSNHNKVHSKGLLRRDGSLSSLSSRQAQPHTFGLQPAALFFHTHRGICAHTDTHEHRSRNTRFHLLLDVTPLLVSSPTPFSACCWHHCVNKNTIFLSSSPGHAVPFISLSFFCGRWGNGYEGLEGSGTRVSCGKPECILWPHSMCPSPPAPPLRSISVPLLAENHRRLHADCILWPQMIWENMSWLMLYSHTALFSLSQACVWFCLCVSFLYLYVVHGVAPVSLGVQVTQAEAFLLAKVNLCHRPADLTRHKVFTWKTHISCFTLSRDFCTNMQKKNGLKMKSKPFYLKWSLAILLCQSYAPTLR